MVQCNACFDTYLAISAVQNSLACGTKIPVTVYSDGIGSRRPKGSC